MTVFILNPAAFSKIVADTPAEIRRCDVYRLLDSCPEGQLDNIVNWLLDNRPDLGDEIRDVLSEIVEERA